MTGVNDTPVVKCETCGGLAKKLHSLCDACILKMMLKKQREDKDTTAIREVQCQRCGTKWLPRTQKPMSCPNQKCRSYYWSTPRVRPMKEGKDHDQ
ncbi:MAG: hypothetical protein ABR985_06190 [Methanotrichaceae archaeon]